MNLQSQRAWITPLVIGAFLLSAVTGLLMFFHLDTALNKAAHEWLSWVLVAGVGLHLGLNQLPFARHLKSRKAQAIIGVFALLLAASFAPLGPKEQPPFVRPVQALARAPLTVLAQVAGTDVAELQARLRAQGLSAGPAQSIQELVGPDSRRQTRILNEVLAAAVRPATGPGPEGSP